MDASSYLRVELFLQCALLAICGLLILGLCLLTMTLLWLPKGYDDDESPMKKKQGTYKWLETPD